MRHSLLVDEYKRAMPGRIIGVLVMPGNRALRAMQTREQHIRRKKRTQYLYIPSLRQYRAMYAVYHGPEGLKPSPTYSSFNGYFSSGLQQNGMVLRHKTWFDTLTIDTADKAAVLQRAKDAEINLRTDIVGAVGVTLSEITTREDVLKFVEIISGKALAGDIDAL